MFNFFSFLCFSVDHRRVHPASRGDHGAGSAGRLQRCPHWQDPHPDQPGHGGTRGTKKTFCTFLCWTVLNMLHTLLFLNVPNMVIFIINMCSCILTCSLTISHIEFLEIWQSPVFFYLLLIYTSSPGNRFEGFNMIPPTIWPQDIGTGHVCHI